MQAIKVEKGIFIDMSCKGITCIPAGYFIPLHSTTAASAHAYEQDLNRFLTQWFPRAQSGELAGYQSDPEPF